MIKKITIITSYFAPAWAYGGPPKVLFTLAKALTNLGIGVDVLTTDSLGETRNDKLEEEIGKIKVYRFKNLSNTLAYKANFFYVPEISQKVAKILETSNVVLFSDTRSIFNWQLYRYINDKKIPYGIFAFGQIPRGFGIKSIIKRLFDIIWVTAFIRNASYRFAQTEHEQKMFNLYFGISISDTQFLPLAVESIVKKPNDNQIRQFKKKLNIVTGDKVLTYVGRIHYLKGIDILVHSVENLLRASKKIKLLIVGRDDGYLRSLVRMIPKDIAKQIIFTGPLYGDEASVVFCVSSCFVFTPRFYEETSLASLEALSFGVPVVTTQQADIPYLESYKAGLVVKNREKDIQNGIKDILSRLETKKEIFKLKAMKLIKEEYNATLIAKTLENYLNDNYEPTN